MGEAYIFDAIRTPRGRGKNTGALHEVKSVDLLKTLFDALRERNSLDTSQVDDVVLGCVTPVDEQGANVAKTASLHAGWSLRTCGMTLNRFCGSGLEALNTASAKIMSGYEDLTVAGGIEAMSRVRMGSDGGAWFADPTVNHNLGFIPQGISADLIATLEGFSRGDVDQFAVDSHKKAAAAQTGGHFKSIIPVHSLNGTLLLDADELVRPDSNLETLAKLKASFTTIGDWGFDSVAQQRYPQVEHIEHVHHAGNSSGIVDGAALILLGSRSKGEELGLRPRARIRSMAVHGSEPTIMLTGPEPATRKALKKAGLTPQDIDLYEINEAFAAVVLKVQRDLELDPERVNVNGGAIALGHPLGATGAMLMGTLVDELERRDKSLGLCTLCIGGGMGIATIVERV